MQRENVTVKHAYFRSFHFHPSPLSSMKCSDASFSVFASFCSLSNLNRITSVGWLAENSRQRTRPSWIGNRNDRNVYDERPEKQNKKKLNECGENNKSKICCCCSQWNVFLQFQTSHHTAIVSNPFHAKPVSYSFTSAHAMLEQSSTTPTARSCTHTSGAHTNTHTELWCWIHVYRKWRVRERERETERMRATNKWTTKRHGPTRF